MKPPLLWRLLLLSSPILGVSYLSASDVLLPLSGEHSGKDLQLFTLLSTSPSQTTYSIHKSFTLCDFLGKEVSTHGGAFRNLQGDLIFSGTSPLSSLTFRNLHLGAQGSGVFSRSTVSFKNLRSLTFENNTSCGGVISAHGSISFLKNHSIQFLNNSSSGHGGAILLASPKASVTFSDQRGPIIFANNKALAVPGTPDSGNGGAISISDRNSHVTFQKNQAILFQGNSAKLGGAISSGMGVVHFLCNASPISFQENYAESGGAIHSELCMFIEQQSLLSFMNNKAEKLGGAICSNKITLQDNTGPILFQNNSAQGGGAISANSCFIFANGNVSFLNNSSKNPGGGAIHLSESSTLHLFARLGNIEFSGNTMVETTKHSETKKRNAIFIKGSPTSITLSANEGQSIFFYDPVLALTHNLRPLEINSPTRSDLHTGSIVFSGDRLSSEELGNNANKTSIFNQPVRLHDGTLSIEGGAILAVHDFTQYGGLLTLGPGSVLMTHNTSSSQTGIQISRLGLNLENHNSLLPAKILSTGKSTILFSGTPEIYDPCGLFYENHELASSPYEMTIILKSEKEVVVTRLPSMNLHFQSSQGNAFPDFVYSGPGYQGSWKFSWSANDTKKQKTLKASWIPSGDFLLNPKKEGSLASTTLWSTFSGLHAAKNTLIDNYLNNNLALPFNYASISGAVISNTMEQEASESSKGFIVKHEGHSISFRLPCSQNTILCGELAQLQGVTSHDRGLSEKSHSQMLLGTLAFHKNWKALSLRSSISYVEDSQIMKLPLSHQRLSRGSWKNHGWAGSLGMSYAYPKGIRYIKITPFVDLEYTHLIQNPFIETGYDPRYFASSELLNLSLPSGIALELRFCGTNSSTLLQASMSYIKDLYRNNPSTKASLILNQHTWETPEIAIGEEAINVKLNATIKYKAITTYLGVSSSQREGNNLSGDAHAGIALSF